MEHVKLRQPKKDNMDLKDKIAKRATQEIKEGMNVNLGIGIPTLCANFLAEDFDVTFQSENGYLGLGQYP
jgi:acyl CoA:acetate/3-ketoacid CoA transferase beta subunit